MNQKAIFLVKPPYLEVANFLRREHGWEIYGFGTGSIPPQLKEGCSGYLDLHELVQRVKAAPVPADIIGKCQQIEEKYAVNLADIISADRHLGIGWITGGLYPRGGFSHLPYEKHLHIIYEVFEALDAFFQEVKPALAFPAGAAQFQGAIIYAICEKYQVPVFGLFRAISASYYYWQSDRFGTVPGLEAAYQKLKSSSEMASDNDIQDASPDIQRIQQALRSKGQVLNLTRRCWRVTHYHAKARIVTILRRGYRTMRRRDTATIVPYEGIADFNWFTRIRTFVRGYLNFKREMRRKYEPLDDLLKSDYVYFPLHVEPEASLIGLEPYFANQTFAIEMLSKSVPAGVNVLVKEHWAGIGNRPARWMDTIAGFPRVKLVNPFESSLELIRHSIATATITGSAGAEAAIMGKPVISLGPNYRFNFVDHVWFANNIPSLRRLLKRIYETRDTADFSRNGALLKRAIELTTFKCQGDLISGQPLETDVRVACAELLKLVDRGGPVKSFTPTDRVADQHIPEELLNASVPGYVPG